MSVAPIVKFSPKYTLPGALTERLVCRSVTKMMAEAREQSIKRMIEDAEKQGANAIVGMRFTTSMVMQNAAEILAYGTGVVVQ